MPSVTKDDGFIVYRVRGGHGDYEWATIVVREWCTQPDPMCGGRKRECGEILIYSSFGSWAHQWGHLGTPFRRWLLTADFGYVFTKFMGEKLSRFDGDASVREMFKTIATNRRERTLDAEQAREAWDLMERHRSQAEASEHDFGYAMLDIARYLDDEHPLHDTFSDPCGWPRSTHDDYQAVGFWRDIWPVFINHLRTELQPAAVAA